MAYVFAANRLNAVDRFYQFALLGLLASSFAALAGSGAIDTLTIVLVVIGLVLRVVQLVGWLPFSFSLTQQWAGLAATAVLALLDYLLIGADLSAVAVHWAALIVDWKLLTAARSGDLRFLAFGQLLAAALLSSYSSFAVCLAIFLFFAVAAYSSSEVRRSVVLQPGANRPTLRFFERRMLLVSAGTSVGILLLTGFLFFLLPRTARAALQHLHLGSGTMSGFASEITLGRLGELRQSNTAVMHIRLHHPDPSKPLKWRGRTLGSFDGRRWTTSDRIGQLVPARGSLSLLTEATSGLGGQRISYDVQMQVPGSGTLFLAGQPEAIQIESDRLIRHPDDSFRLLSGATSRARYTGYSLLSDPTSDGGDLPVELTPQQRWQYTQLPHVDLRIPILAHQVGGDGPEISRASAIANYLRTQFRYTTKLLDRPVDDPLAHFLFERRAGHCEYFASAMAVMLRTQRIPARIATGFQSGYYNPLSGLQVIRGADAHSWVEAYIQGRGWVTFDPTPPDNRVGHNSFWNKAELYFDAADSFWQEWVLHYDLERQFMLAVRLDQSRRGWNLDWWQRAKASVAAWQQDARERWRQHGLVATAIVILLLAAVLFQRRIRQAIRVYWQRQRVRRGQILPGDAAQLYQQMLHAMHRKGVDKPGWLTPGEFAAVQPVEWRQPVSDFTRAYQELRYGGRQEAAYEMLDLLNTLERSR